MEFLPVINLIMLGLLSVILYRYLYLRSKSVAGQEQLNAVASQISDIKSSYQEENELLITNLQILTNRKSILASERKDTIINLFTSLNEWVWDGLNVSITDYNHTNYQEITARQATIRDQYNRSNISFGRMQLVINDDQLIKSGYEAIMETLRLHHFVESTLKNFLKSLSWEKTLLDKITSKDYDFFKISPDMRTFYERQASESEAAKNKILEGYNDRHWEHFKPVVEKLNEFRDLTKETLNEMRKEMPNGLSEGRWSSLK